MCQINIVKEAPIACFAAVAAEEAIGLGEEIKHQLALVIALSPPHRQQQRQR